MVRISRFSFHVLRLRLMTGELQDKRNTTAKWSEKAAATVAIPVFLSSKSPHR
jgi:hypothetical protein